MISHVTSSASWLTSQRVAANTSIFSLVQANNTSFFDEGPLTPQARHTTLNSTGSIDTTIVDPYTQGVEITTQTRYDAGVVKIWSGEPGHALLKNSVGMNKSIDVFSHTAFIDMDRFNAAVFISVQDQSLLLPIDQLLTFPIVVGDNDQSENSNFNGVIEPLAIRRVASFTSIDHPYEPHSIRAELSAGNLDSRGGSDQILTVYDFKSQLSAAGAFVDSDGMIFEHPTQPESPFIDERLLRNSVPRLNEDVDIVTALSMMTGSTGDYIEHNQHSAACGLCYDNSTIAGTDSLAFGGMTY